MSAKDGSVLETYHGASMRRSVTIPGLVRTLRAIRCLSVASFGMRPRGAGGTRSSWARRPVAMNVVVPWSVCRVAAAGQVVLRAVAGIDEGLFGLLAGVGGGLVEHRGVAGAVRGAPGDVGSGDDLMGFVNDGLGVVGLDVGAVAVFHDP